MGAVPARRVASVAIVVPLSLAPQLSADEDLSLQHLMHFLGRYDRYFVAPAGTRVSRDGFHVVHFDRAFFGSAAAHNRLLMDRRFYRRFSAYEYILIYHLDSLVFADELADWCRAGWDYIGAPWVPCREMPWVTEPRVGNGGFTLMNVSRVLQVLRNRHRQRPMTRLSDAFDRRAHLFQPVISVMERIAARCPSLPAVRRIVEHCHRNDSPGAYGCNNDFFWSFEATRYLPSFTIAPVDEGLRFAFEAAPRLCFEWNRRCLPFGCHAWTKFDRAFWEPYLLGSACIPAS